MSEKYYIGIDGGGTYTKAVAVSSSGELVFSVTGETINFNAVCFDDARKNLEGVFDDITTHIPEQSISRVFIGCSALDSKADSETVKTLMGKYSFLNADMNSDLYVALFGHSFGDRGAMGIALDKKGEIIVCGGWGYAIGDEGSAYYIATEGLKAAARMTDGREEKTALYDAMMSFYGLDDPYLLIDKIYQPTLSRNKTAKFAKVVSECAEKGDTVALSILDKSANELALLATTLLRKSNISDKLAVYGGVLQHNKYILTRFEEILQKDFPSIDITFPKALPEFGAVAAAMNIDGALDEKIIEKLCSYR